MKEANKNTLKQIRKGLIAFVILIIIFAILPITGTIDLKDAKWPLISIGSIITILSTVLYLNRKK